MVQLRNYQNAAVEAVTNHLSSKKTNPGIVLPTGSGKSYVIAEICRRARQDGKRVLVLAHVRELLEQNASKINEIDPSLDVGIYSAGLDRREHRNPIVLAGIQSAYSRPHVLGRRDLLIVDEAHLIPDHKESMYRKLLSHFDCPLIGLTATPYRMTSGTIFRDSGPIHELAYEAKILSLVEQGYLSQVISRLDLKDLDFSRLRVRGGEFLAKDAEEMMSEDEIVEKAVRRIIELTEKRSSILIFCSGVKHAKKVLEAIQKETGKREIAELVVGSTPSMIRDEIIMRFKRGNLKYLLNVNVLTTGFDSPNIDAICLLRPTMSPGLYYQMVGRGLRKHESKTNCLILDFAGNVKRHGTIEEIIPPSGSDDNLPSKNGSGSKIRICPLCEIANSRTAKACLNCHYFFIDDEDDAPKHSDDLTNVMNGWQKATVYYEHWSIYLKRKHDRIISRTVRVDFHTDFGVISHWLAPEHGHFGIKKTLQFLSARGVRLSEPPRTASECLKLFDHPNLKRVKNLFLIKKENSRYWDIVNFICE